MQIKIKYPLKEIKKGYKEARNWWNTFILKPIMVPTLWFTANFTRLTPNTITTLSLFLYLTCGIFFLRGDLTLGAIFFELGVLGDAIDGKLARLKFKSTKFGAWYDTWVDNLGHFIAAITLGYGYYLFTQNKIWLLLGGLMFYIKIHHVLEGNMSLRLMGEKRYEQRISKGSDGQKGWIPTIKKFLLKRGLRDPLSGSDIKNLLFFVGPLFRILDILLLIILPIFFIKSMIWFCYYKKELDHLDSINS